MAENKNEDQDENEIPAWQTVKQVAQRLGVTEPVVHSWIRDKLFIAYDFSRKGETPRWRVNKIAVEAFAKSRANITVPA